ncbi:hypothetical protein DHEL01_v202158 [Diaporthe helianthi]|uniref:Fungal N-terminal domain-containing protein n=1 Tax=Diaporthe helianthi TaxID=158607 RepID=A0A2P5IAD2_DIAHE|nr:hypothetical protein DHEL01_v202158 [Diaporthe helianthi]
MSFGFGIGDIIACSEVAWKTINALKSAGSDFEGLRLDLASLTSVLQALEAEAKGPMPLINTASAERQAQMRLLLRNCKESMEDLQGVVGKYRGWNADKKRDFVAWMRFAAKDKRGPREKLAVHTASINIFLTTLSHGSLARLEFLIKNGPQAAHQTPGPIPDSDGTKGLDFSASGMPWSGSLASSKRKEGAVWQNIGRSLQDEGISDKDLDAFQEEIKAYARYLVRGQTPFWREPVQVSNYSEMHVVAERREQEGRRRKGEQTRLEIEERSRKDAEWYRRRQREEDYTKIELEGEGEELRFQRVTEARRQDDHMQSTPLASTSARDEEEVKKSMLREELKRARQSQYLDTAVLSDSEPERRKAKLRQEEKMKRRKEGPAGTGSRTDQEEDVVSLAYTFQGLFDFEAGPTQSTPLAGTPGDENETVPLVIPGFEEDNKHEREGRTARVYEIQRRLGRLVDRRDRYIREGRRDEVADLEVNDIPEQVRLLKLEGMDVSHERAWKWTHQCNVCHFLIPSNHYHCAKCGGGNWDACQECWDEGARCSSPGQHRITFNGRTVV